MKTILILILLLTSCSKNIYVGGYDPDRVDTVYVYPDGSDWYHGQDTTTKTLK